MSTLDSEMDECLKSVADGKALLATSISTYVTTASDATWAIMNTNMKSAFSKRYNSGISAADARVNTNSASYTNGYDDGYEDGSSNSNYVRLCLLLFETKKFVEGAIASNFKIVDSRIFTNNSGILTCNVAGTYTVFADGYWSWYYFNLYNTSGTKILSKSLTDNERYFDITVEVGYTIKIVDSYSPEESGHHAVVGIFQS